MIAVGTVASPADIGYVMARVTAYVTDKKEKQAKKQREMEIDKLVRLFKIGYLRKAEKNLHDLFWIHSLVKRAWLAYDRKD